MGQTEGFPMSFEDIPHNLRRLRRLAGLTQKALAERAGLPLSAIRGAELSRVQPEMATVNAIANALGFKINVLVDPFRELRHVRFRSTWTSGNRGQILFKAAKSLDHLNLLISRLRRRVPFSLGDMRETFKDEGIVEIAGRCRKSLGLRRDESIPDLGGLLAKAGVKVLPLTITSGGFLGLSVSEADGGPAVVVNDWELIPVERRLFSAAHELGHLILHPDAYDREFCNFFCYKLGKNIKY